MKFKVLRPFYYESFTCIGGECKDTCCAGWNISIDKDTFENYMQVTGEFGEKLKKSIVRENNPEFILDEKRACPFLNSNNLCDIYIHLGENNLCQTCKTYPRIIHRHDDIYEQNLTLSCPEVAKILVSYTEPIDFSFGECEENMTTVNNSKNEILFNALLLGRSISVDIIQHREFPLWKRLFLCINIADKIQKNIDLKCYSDIQESIKPFQKADFLISYMEQLDTFHSNALLKLELYVNLLNIILDIKIGNKVFLDYVAKTALYLNQLDNVEKLNFIEEAFQDFDVYYKEKEYIYDNFLVYFIFRYYMEAHEKEDIYKYIVNMTTGYSLIKLFAVVFWYCNGHVLSDEKQIEILYSFSRATEHSTSIIEIIYQKLSEKGFQSLAYLVSLII